MSLVPGAKALLGARPRLRAGRRRPQALRSDTWRGRVTSRGSCGAEDARAQNMIINDNHKTILHSRTYT